MGITIVPLSNADVSDARNLLARWWKCDWTEDVAVNYFAWRYGEEGSGKMLLAFDGQRPVAILDSFVRPYWIAGRRVAVRETCDWFCLPEYRTFGIGLHLIRRMMAKPEPILSIGGSEFTLNLLPRLKWMRLRDVDQFVLPVSAQVVAELVAQRLWPRGVALARLVPRVRLVRRLARRHPPSPEARVRPREPGESWELGGIAAHDVTPGLDTALLDWLTRAPSVVGDFLLLNFFCDGRAVGLSISRLERLPFGHKALIVHWHATELDLIDWIISETVHNLVERGAGAIFCRTSCLATSRALGRLGFFRHRPRPVYWWPSDGLPASSSLHLTSLRADDGLGLPVA
jgi:hypothetical protein